MKRVTLYLMMCLGMALSGLPGASCGDANEGVVSVSGVALDLHTLNLAVGGDAVLTATIEPAGATDQRLVWNSSDPGIATVSAGYIEALSTGSTTITVSAGNGGFTDECEVNVTESVQKIEFKWNTATVEKNGAPYSMPATVSPASAGDPTLVWTTGNAEVATVTASGAVAGVNVGKTTVTATAADGGGTSATWTVTVVEAPNMSACQSGAPRWGTDPGVVSFKTDRTWQTGDLLWSDVVVSTVCSARTSYLGRDSEGLQYYCDCRKGNDGFGDLFSWCGMASIRHQICPDGWRIPTSNDFIALDIALGGTGENRPFLSVSGPDIPILAKYTGDEWGGGYGGNSTWDNVLARPNVEAYYWGQTAGVDNTQGMYLGFKTNGHIFVRQSTTKDFGMPVRCVR
jgi:uncharacterized protein (TIGR02145 family)